MTVSTKRLLKCLVAISMVACWLDCCSARPEYDHGIYETPVGHGEEPSDKFGRTLRKDDEATIENNQWDAEKVRGKDNEPETSADMELDRSARNLQGLRQFFNSEANTDAKFPSPGMHEKGPSKALRKKSSTDQTSETQIEENSADDLGNFVRSILDDVNVLTQHAESILNSLKIVLSTGPENSCSDCLSTLSATTYDYDNTRTVVMDFLERGQETAERLTNEPSSRMIGVADVEGSELPRGHDILACTTRLKRRLFRLLELARGCMSRRNDSSRLSDVEAVEQSISSIDSDGFGVLENLKTRYSGMSNRGAANRPAFPAPRFHRTSPGSSATKYYSMDSSANRPYTASSDSYLGARTSSRSSSDVIEDRVLSHKITKEIETYGTLLYFLRTIPTILSDVLSLVDSVCTVESTREESYNDGISGPITEPPYRLEEMVTTTRRPATAHYSPKLTVAFPPNLGNENSGSSSSSSSHDDSNLLEPEQSDEPGYSRNLAYEEIVGAPRTGGAVAPPFTHTYGHAHGGSYQDSLTPSGPWSYDSSAGNPMAHRFPPGRYPHCFYVNTIRYEGPVNSYGAGTPFDLYGHQHHQPPPFPFDPTMMAHDNYENDISHIPIDNIALPLNSDEHHPPGHLHSDRIKLNLQHGLVALGAYDAKSGDFLVLNLGKCSLVGKLDKTSRYIELQLFGKPIAFIKSAGRYPNRIWQVPLVNFRDIVGANVLKELRRECERRSSATSTRYRYVRATTKCTGNYDL